MEPGGVMNPDKLRQNDRALAFEGVLRGEEASGGDLPRTVDIDRCRCGQGLANDLLSLDPDRPEERRRAWVVVDQGLVSRRKPDDIPRLQPKDD